TTTLTATKDGISSNTVNVDICSIASACIDIFDSGSGKLFTNTPSVPYLDSIGGSASSFVNVFAGDTLGLDGRYSTFSHSQANLLCTTYNTQNLAGRTNWRLPTRDELKMELYDRFGNMGTARGWSVYLSYWSTTPFQDTYYFVSLKDGALKNNNASVKLYASCVSEP
ncbi:DUF1566 domain-containing protein, partial [Shewanella algae]|uniref:Lcl domain-containing protein n=1 Tax=Shewanella algae TaxID=38313 RepID=UPI0023597EC6